MILSAEAKCGDPARSLPQGQYEPLIAVVVIIWAGIFFSQRDVYPLMGHFREPFRVNMSFFVANGIISIVLCSAAIIDIMRLAR